MRMPEMDGVETIVNIRLDFPQVKIIAMSGGSLESEHLLQVALSQGAHRALTKPFALEELLEAIEALVGQQPLSR